ncbi:Cell division control protein 14, SIN component family protein [Candida parapsilosis]|uniref:Uncharacterized protein n=2 Tax=Candida parapsilosis TaxID=5480 RepID=G8BDH9_CANPC|nr:uncharacterized protein CPAR2_209710 [Candida parapsilosis]KAF6054523.1 Cell division control protein 14, SIN component family protein [Candida parapsilosis]KAF6056452.1 Cell division control protein 14, SIN component family protein [Candida parapsilosis]KAF6059386.1 Cell division control protein 14, SIN component family protein [Candida parapsilosis]KAF6068141.1 Cell division control protein 14, SIN component family protein [Candida parapsilosis]KAI5905224.1 hypothetical protein K4G60_g448
MEKEVSFVLEGLENSTLVTASPGLKQLENLLQKLLPEIEQFQNNGIVAPRLRELINLQDNFAYNITVCLVRIYEKDLHKDDTLLLNRLLQGLLLLHPSSKNIFNRDRNMRLILDLLDDYNKDLEITISVITTLIHVLLKNYENYRSFERNRGCLKLIRHLKLDSTDVIPVDDVPQSSSVKRNGGAYSLQQHLNFKVIEFLMFYMSEEIDNPNPHDVDMKADLFREVFPAIDSLIESLNELNKL